MYPSSLGFSFVVSQQVLPGGQFTGAEYGRARATLPQADPNAVVIVAAKLYGSLANGLTVQLVDLGPGNVVDKTYVEQVGTAIRVMLRRAVGGGPLAIGAEVAETINSYARWTSIPIVAKAQGTGLGVCAVTAAIGLVDGADPTSNDGTTFKWAPNTAPDLGFFYFEQDAPVVVRQLEAKFELAGPYVYGTYELRVNLVPLDELLDAIAAEEVPMFIHSTLTTAAPDIAIADTKIVVPPRWAIRVTTSDAIEGIVRLHVKRDANFQVL